MKNFSVKAFSLLIAIILVYFVKSESNSTVMTFGVPVHIRNLSKEKVILFPAIKQVQVTVRGPSFYVSGIYSNPPLFKIEIPEDAGNRLIVPLQAKSLGLPPSIEVLNIDPGEIEFTLDDRIKKVVQIVVPRIGSLEDGKKVSKILISPPEVELEGPQIEVKEISKVETVPIDFREISDNFKKEVGLRLPGKFTKLSQNTVKLEVNVLTINVEKKFKSIPIEVRSSGDVSIGISPSVVDIEISGSEALIKKLNQRDIVPYVKVMSDQPNRQKVEIEVELPKGLSVIAKNPEFIKVMRKKK